MIIPMITVNHCYKTSLKEALRIICKHWNMYVSQKFTSGHVQKDIIVCHT